MKTEVKQLSFPSALVTKMGTAWLFVPQLVFESLRGCRCPLSPSVLTRT